MILVLNCGSATLKYTLFEENLKVVSGGEVDRIGAIDAFITTSNGETTKIVQNIPDHETAIEFVLDNLLKNVIQKKEDIIAVGHRVVHGGEKLTSATIVTEEVKQEIKKSFVLAPLHNPHNLEGIIAVEKLLPKAINVAVFDTAFHHTIPDYAYLYALPYYLYKKYSIRKFGFHGISHQFVAERSAEILNKPLNKLKLITCHLGNGCSITAIKYGVSVDTSMGFTPLEGLIMGTRCGDIDPSIVTYLMASEGLTINQINTLLTGQSGLYGISGISNDMRLILEEYSKGNQRAELAIKMFCYRVKKYIGFYLAVLNGADAVVFTGGIGQNSSLIREECLKDMSNLGIEIDKKLNEKITEGIISSKKSKIKIIVIPTNEEFNIAKQVLNLTKKI
ncbi:MAG: acetate/propionate family kinase [Endomicrobiia bacterium]